MIESAKYGKREDPIAKLIKVQSEVINDLYEDSLYRRDMIYPEPLRQKIVGRPSLMSLVEGRAEGDLLYGDTLEEAIDNLLKRDKARGKEIDTLVGDISSRYDSEKEKDAEIERLKEEVAETEKSQYKLCYPDGTGAILSIKYLDEGRKVNEAFIGEVRKLKATIKERDADSEGLEQILSAIQEKCKEVGLDNFDTLSHEEMVEGLVDIIVRLKGKLSYISVECNKLPHFDEYPNETDKVDAILTALIHYKNSAKALTESLTRARKSESEKRKLMQIMKSFDEDHSAPEEMLTEFKAWQKDQAKKLKAKAVK